MKKSICLLMFVLSTMIGISQDLDQAERSALDCLNGYLHQTGKDYSYFIKSGDIYQELSEIEDVPGFMEKKAEVDAVLEMSGIFKDNYMNAALLKNCMMTSYPIEALQNDKASSFYYLWEHLDYIENNPEMMIELSPIIHINALQSLLSEDDFSKDFYRVFQFIIVQGIIYESEHAVASSELNDSENILSGESGNNTFVVVEDEPESIDIDEFVFVEEAEMQAGNSGSLNGLCGKDIFIFVEEMPQYPGGDDALNSYFCLESEQCKGKVYIQFVVDVNGKAREPKILRGIGPGCDQKAIELVENMQLWVPGKQMGENVCVYITRPVLFY